MHDCRVVEGYAVQHRQHRQTVWCTCNNRTQPVLIITNGGGATLSLQRNLLLLISAVVVRAARVAHCPCRCRRGNSLSLLEHRHTGSIIFFHSFSLLSLCVAKSHIARKRERKRERVAEEGVGVFLLQSLGRKKWGKN